MKQLLPRAQEELPVIDEGDGRSEDLTRALCNDHLDCGVLLKILDHLKELSLTYGCVIIPSHTLYKVFFLQC